jgi:hypothetical protein
MLKMLHICGEGVEPEAAVAQALGDRIGVALAAGAPLSDTTRVVHATGMSSDALAARLASEPDVAFDEPAAVRGKPRRVGREIGGKRGDDGSEDAAWA